MHPNSIPVNFDSLLFISYLTNIEFSLLGLVPLHNASSYGHLDIAALLIKHATMVNATDKWGKELLIRFLKYVFLILFNFNLQYPLGSLVLIHNKIIFYSKGFRLYMSQVKSQELICVPSS